VIVAVAVAVTLVVVTVKVAVVAFAATVTLAGTCAAELLLARVTTAPPAGAAELNVTVPVDEMPPTTLVGLSDNADTVRCVMLSVAVLLLPLYVAVIVAVAVAVTLVVVTVKVAVVALAATVTVAGTCAAALLLDSVTTAPPAGAGEVNVTVPVEEIPPTTLVGFNDNAETPGAVTERLALLLAPL